MSFMANPEPKSRGTIKNLHLGVAEATDGKQSKMAVASCANKPKTSGRRARAAKAKNVMPVLVDVSALKPDQVRMEALGKFELSEGEAAAALKLFAGAFQPGRMIDIKNEENRISAQREVCLGDRLVEMGLSRCVWPIGRKIIVTYRKRPTGEVQARAALDGGGVGVARDVDPLKLPGAVREAKTAPGPVDATVPANPVVDGGVEDQRDQQPECPVEMVKPLSRTAENSGTTVPDFDLSASEQIIEANLGDDYVVGRELARIRSSEKIKNWDRYCKERWKRTKRWADYLMGAVRVIDQLKLPQRFPTRRLRPLIGLTPIQQDQAWKRANEFAMKSDGQPTAASIRMAVQQTTGRTSGSPAPEWSLNIAQRTFQRGVEYAAKKALLGATSAQTQTFADELPALLDHTKELLCGTALSRGL